MTTLNERQNKVLQHFKIGDNIFLTGSAGTGKTYLVKHIREICETNKMSIALTAMTGTAAYLIGGKTLHSWAGIGLGDKSVEELVDKIGKYPVSLMRWINTKILIIDEISMMSNILLEKLNEIGQILRSSKKPFGGIQLIFSGDFYQLPPVVKEEDSLFCFESMVWNQLIDVNVVLDEIIRQKEPSFQKCMEEARKGKLSEESIEILNTCLGKKISDKIIPTKIYSYRENVDAINSNNLKKLGSTIKTFKSNYYTKYNGKKTLLCEEDSYLNNMKTSLQYNKYIKLSVGSQVMLTINLNSDSGLTNGSRGVVIEFKNNFPVVLFKNGDIIEIPPYELKCDILNKTIYIEQIPLILAWAITVHKSQGASIDLAEIDLGSTLFTYGQGYVALSRVRNIEGLSLIAFEPRKIRAHPKVKQFYKLLK